MLKKIPQKVYYNSQYIAHYDQFEPTIMLTKTDTRHNETSYTISSATISLLPCAQIRKWVPAV